MKNKLIIDAAKDKIFFMIINNDINYNITHENTKNNFEKLIILINDFLSSKNLKIKDISGFYVNRGPGSFAGIRNSLSTIKAIHLVEKIDYYCYSFQDFVNIKKIKYENIPDLCDKFKVKKNLINPIYIS
jgi:tRNA threonylcarbamoyladenosine biosynthesis protein TsaB